MRMASGIKDPNQSSQKIEVVHSISAWFKGETIHQLDEGFRDHAGTPAKTRDGLLKKKIPHEWNKFRRIRSGHEEYPDTATRQFEIGRRALKTCVAAQSAFVWHEVASGKSREKAMQGSLALLDGYVARVEAGKPLPSYSLLNRPVADAVNEFASNPSAYDRPVSVFNNLVYLATSAIIEQTNEHDGPILPKPGIADGVVIPWKY